MRNITVLAAMLGALTVAAPAAAVIEVATYTGVLASGTDFTGLFGPAASNLAGVSYVATLTYDSSLGTHLGSTFDEQYGGSNYGVASPIVSATLKINGVSVAFAADTTGVARTGLGVTSYNATHQANSHSIVNLLAIGAYFDAPSSLATTYSAKPVNSFGSFVITTIGTEVGGTTVYASGTFGGVSSISVTDVPAPAPAAAVPEPAAWAMMLTGFGLIGIAARRRMVGPAA